MGRSSASSVGGFFPALIQTLQHWDFLNPFLGAPASLALCCPAQDICLPVSDPCVQAPNPTLTSGKPRKRISLRGAVREAGVCFSKLGQPWVASSVFKIRESLFSPIWIAFSFLSFLWGYATVSIWVPQSYSEALESVEISYYILKNGKRNPQIGKIWVPPPRGAEAWKPRNFLYPSVTQPQQIEQPGSLSWNCFLCIHMWAILTSPMAHSFSSLSWKSTLAIK